LTAAPAGLVSRVMSETCGSQIVDGAGARAQGLNDFLVMGMVVLASGALIWLTLSERVARA